MERRTKEKALSAWKLRDSVQDVTGDFGAKKAPVVHAVGSNCLADKGMSGESRDRRWTERELAKNVKLEQAGEERTVFFCERCVIANPLPPLKAVKTTQPMDAASVKTPSAAKKTTTKRAAKKATAKAS